MAMQCCKPNCWPASDDAALQTHFPGQHFIVRQGAEFNTMSRTMTPRIQALSGPLEQLIFFLDEEDTNVGRGARNHIRLDDPLVSLKHCRICFEVGSCWVKDWGSEHGTFVNEFSFPAKAL